MLRITQYAYILVYNLYLGYIMSNLPSPTDLILVAFMPLAA